LSISKDKNMVIWKLDQEEHPLALASVNYNINITYI